MRSFIVIGLGRFGSAVASSLYRQGCEVLALDVNNDLVQQIPGAIYCPTLEDVAAKLESGGEFRALSRQVEQRLGKRLTTPDLGILLGLYDHLGLPADVIYLLVCHCTERLQRRYGEGRRPTARQIEKEGCLWAQMGICDQQSAAEYLRTMAQRQEKAAAYMHALQIHDRPPVDSEMHYLKQWWEQGFPPETVALAYDKTVFQKKELNFTHIQICLQWMEFVTLVI